MSVFPYPGPPGIITARRVNFRRIFEGQGAYLTLPGGGYIDGPLSQDPANTIYSTNVFNLECGLLMGVEGSGGANPGFWAPSILGLTLGTTSANGTPYTSGGTALTVGPLVAAYLATRIGSSGTGTVKIIGPPTASGTVAATAMTYSAVNITTGVITLTSLGVNKVIGSIVAPADGSEIPVSFIGDGCGINVNDPDGAIPTQVQWPNIPVAGIVVPSTSEGASQNGFINWPADPSLRNFIMANLNTKGQIGVTSTYAGGPFIFTNTL